MPNLKSLLEFDEKYKDIPEDFGDRFKYLWEILKIKEKDLKEIKTQIKHIKSIKKNTINLVVNFKPEATPRPRLSMISNTFYVKGASEYKRLFEKAVEENNIELITTPCEFHCITYTPIPTAMSKIEKVLAELGLIPNISKPDWDNMAKTYCDMIQHGLVLDDSLIYKGTLEKRYSIKPRVEITIKYFNKYDSTFNKKKIQNIIEKRKNKKEG